MKNELNLVELSFDEQAIINGGNLGYDAGYAIGYTINFDIKVAKFYYNLLFN